jgi:hypothetical protein
MHLASLIEYPARNDLSNRHSFASQLAYPWWNHDAFVGWIRFHLLIRYITAIKDSATANIHSATTSSPFERVPSSWWWEQSE